MTTHVHHLEGCAPAPLAHYLKALGVLRIVAEQRDPTARGWWQDEHFCLLTRLDQGALEQFFLEEYAPTPFLSPWNKGSGFYAAEDAGLTPLERSSAPRFAPFRQGIADARVPLDALARADAEVRALKDQTKKKKGMTAAEAEAAVALKDDPEHKQKLAAAQRQFSSLKGDVFLPYQRAWRGPLRAWMDAAAVLPDSGKPAFPSLLGTGGNDGRLDFTNNAMQRMAELFALDDPMAPPRADTPALLRAALFGGGVAGLQYASVGQFLPGGAGGANSTTGADGDSLVNPWDFVLMLEGALLFAARVTRRLDSTASKSKASAPFALHGHAAGHATPGNEKAERGEQWMPLWGHPTSLAELHAMVGEARVQLGRQSAYRPVDVARAISRLGVARGITAFSRYGYLERNGQSNLAVPLGRIAVRAHPRARLIDDLAPWLDRLQRAARDKHAPNRLVAAERRLADAVFAALTHTDEPARWQGVLLAAEAIEEMQAAGTAIAAGPIPPLSPEWVAAILDGTPEVHLALALGSAAAVHPPGRSPIDPVRHHWLPLQRGAHRFATHDKRLARDPRVVMTARDPAADAMSLVERRLVEATSRGQRTVPLQAALRCGAHPEDLAALLAGDVDLRRTLALARALMAVDWSRWTGAHAPPRRRTRVAPDDAWLALRLVFLPWPVSGDRPIPADLATLRRLETGDATGAVAGALRRLNASGIRPPLRAAVASPELARRWGAALAFPIELSTARECLAALQPSIQGAHHA